MASIISTYNNGPVTATDVSGKSCLDVNVASGTISVSSGSATGAAVPANAEYIAANKSGTLVGLLLDASGFLQVSATALPLPSGASTSAKQDTGNTSLASIDGKITAVNTGAVVVSSSALPSGASTSAAQTTGNNSLSSIDGKITAVNTGAVVVSSSALPSGASTAAKQPALGTAGTASADVISVQGIASMTPVQVSQATAANLKATVVQATQNGSGAASTSIGSGAVVTFTAPANSIGFVAQAAQGNAVNLRWFVGTDPSTTSGIQLAPGQDTGVVMIGQNFRVIAESGSSKEANVQWILSA